MALDLTKTKGTKASQDDRHEIWGGSRSSTIRSRGVRGVGSCDAARTTGFESCIRQAEAFGICRAFCVSAQNFFGKCQANIFQRHQFSAASFQFSVFSFQQLAVFRGPVFPHLRLLAVVALFASCHTAQLVHVALHFARFLGLGFGRVRGGGALDWDIVSYSEKRLSGSGRVKLVTKLVSGWRWQKANEKPATGHSSISVYLAIRSEATPTGPRRMVLCWLKQAQQSLLHVWFLKESQTQMVQGSIYNENL